MNRALRSAVPSASAWLPLFAGLALVSASNCSSSGGQPDSGNPSPDAGLDAGTDAGPDAGSDAGASDAGPDGGPDAGPDGGLDAGVDGGTDAGAQGPFGTFTSTLDIGGASRTYVLNAPSSIPASAAPLLVALHGGGDTPSNFMVETALGSQSLADGFVLALPAGANGTWGGDLTPEGVATDISFVLGVVKDVQAHYSIDPKRIYLTGFSVGAVFAGGIATASGLVFNVDGGFSYRDPFAAVATSAGADLFGGKANLELSSPKVPFWHIHGTADTTIPIAADETFFETQQDAGWPNPQFTAVTGAPHDWLWASQYGHSDQELWDFFSAHPLP